MQLSTRTILAAAVVGMAAVGARAQTQTFTNFFGPATTNWNTTLLFPLFDPSLGTLLSVDFFLTGDLTGNIRFESQDGAPATITTNLNGQIILMRPDSTTLTSVAPALSSVDSVAASDGVLDFGGASGRSHLGLTTSTSSLFSSNNPLDLGLFTGVGNIGLKVKATGQSKATGSGNLVTFNQTQAAANVKVVYNYQVNRLGVPEPGEWAAMGVLSLGLGGLVVRARRKRA